VVARLNLDFRKRNDLANRMRTPNEARGYGGVVS
jgi:hypothetical protein